MSLPPFGGQYNVGLSSWSSKVPKLTFGTAKTKITSQAAFELEEIAFEVFYPCEEPPRNNQSPVGWLKRPLVQWAEGYGAFLGRSKWILYPLVLLTSFVKIPAFSDPPLKTAPEQKRWPLMIFSHGLAGTSRTYSQLCGKLAAEGNVVVAMEHRDGTAPSTIHSLNGTLSSHFYVKVDSLMSVFQKTLSMSNNTSSSWPDKLENPTTPLPLRTQQLEIRQVEILQAFKAMKSLVNGDVSLLEEKKDASYWSSWHHQVDVEKVTFVGHSFGSCTGLYLLANPPPSNYEPLPFHKAILHDPWMEPLREDFEEAFLRGSHNISVPVLLINSEEFTLWKDHMGRQQRLMQQGARQGVKEYAFFTMVGARHMGFSDFTILAPFYRGRGMSLQNDIHKISSAFLNGTLDECLESMKDKLVENYIVDDPDDNKKKKIRAQPGQIINHPISIDN